MKPTIEPLTEEGRRLATAAAGRALSIAERYARKFPEHAADLQSAATYGVVRAASSYVTDLGGAWVRWLGACVKGEIKDFLDSAQVRNYRQTQIGVSFDGVPVTDDTAIRRVDAAHDLVPLLAGLPEKHRRLCRLIYQEGMTPSAAGKYLGYTPNHGDKLHREAIDLLRDQKTA